MNPPQIPPTTPPPECWGWELEYLIGRLSDRLDLWKAYGCLTISLDAAHILPRRSSQFSRCLNSGSQTLCNALRQRFTCEVNQQPLSEFQTPTLTAMTQACCVDDVNLDHVFSLLRMIELLENCRASLTTRHHAQILCAVIGELELVANDLSSAVRESNQQLRNQTTEDSKKSEDSRLKCASLLRATQKQLIDLIAESGRDRATYMKDMFSRIPFSGPRPRFCDASAMSAFRSDTALQSALQATPLSIYAMGADGDKALMDLLLGGSLASIWHRLHQLWTTIDPTRRSRGDRESRAEEIIRSSSVADRIRWAVFHTVPQMSRSRRLLFTRCLESLCSPIFISPPSHLTNQVAGSTHSPAALVRLVVDAFLDTRIPLWPYESEAQLDAMDQTPLLPEEVKRRLKAVICVPDAIVFCTREDHDVEQHLEWTPGFTVSAGSPDKLTSNNYDTTSSIIDNPSWGAMTTSLSNPFQSHVSREKFKRAVENRFEEQEKWRRMAEKV